MTGLQTYAFISFTINPSLSTHLLGSFFSALGSFSVQFLLPSWRPFPPLFAGGSSAPVIPTGGGTFTEAFPMLQASRQGLHFILCEWLRFSCILRRTVQGRGSHLGVRGAPGGVSSKPLPLPFGLRAPPLWNLRVWRRCSGRKKPAAHADMAALVARGARGLLKRADFVKVPRRHRYKKKWVRSSPGPRREQ